ncbi:MAG: transglutaminase family protein [Burkholderiales bacterium]|nr:transglutaminase family protein [Burkholderiales bacterium]GIK87978.1 MAG: transglutaminase [Betaproteobacteria bacterium]
MITLAPARERSGSRVRIRYRVALRYEVDGPSDFIFLIHPARTAQQHVTGEALDVLPEADHAVETDLQSGNRLLKLRAGAGTLDVRLQACVDVVHHMARPEDVVAAAPAALPASTLRYLTASRYCQTDRLQQHAWSLFGGLPRGYAQVQAVCDWVRGHVEFRAGTSHPGTSALETFDTGIGVCRDFAHLAITLCRALNYPARFVTGVDYGADPSLGPPDFHAYVEVYLDRWYLFDPTGISPTTGLIRIATGADAADVSFATIFGPVRTGMPLLAFDAVEDAEAGVLRPRATPLAVSTALV